MDSTCRVRIRRGENGQIIHTENLPRGELDRKKRGEMIATRTAVTCSKGKGIWGEREMGGGERK